MATLAVVSFPAEPQAFDIEASAVAATPLGDRFLLDGVTGFWIHNGPMITTVRFMATRLCEHGDLHNAIVFVSPGFVGFLAATLDPRRFADGDGEVEVLYTGADISAALVAAVRIA